MKRKASFRKHILEFKKTSRTSRGELNTHTAWIIQIEEGTRTGYGEASPLKGLSMDDRDDFEATLRQSCMMINEGLPIDLLPIQEFPSLQFGFETAEISLNADQPFTLFPNGFVNGKGININGLVWMSSKEEMLKEAHLKVEAGFRCLKFKIGGLDFDEECRMLESIRKLFNAFRIEIRLDANGAFDNHDALKKITELSRFDIHSIEQPVKPGQTEWMAEICHSAKIKIALDEELIGTDVEADGASLLHKINPAFIILKPTLIGGLAKGDRWISLARKKGIDWWATSALESNIGLNAIAQWCSNYDLNLPQGLGTGSLYTNNIKSPLYVEQGQLHYSGQAVWEIPEE